MFVLRQKSAQESRRKKKVYMDQLEEQVKEVTGQNKVLTKRVKELEKENGSLQQQLKTLQGIFGRATRNTKATGTCLMVLISTQWKYLNGTDETILKSQWPSIDRVVSHTRFFFG